MMTLLLVGVPEIPSPTGEISSPVGMAMNSSQRLDGLKEWHGDPASVLMWLQ